MMATGMMWGMTFFFGALEGSTVLYAILREFYTGSLHDLLKRLAMRSIEEISISFLFLSLDADLPTI